MRTALHPLPLRPLSTSLVAQPNQRISKGWEREASTPSPFPSRSHPDTARLASAASYHPRIRDPPKPRSFRVAKAATGSAKGSAHSPTHPVAGRSRGNDHACTPSATGIRRHRTPAATSECRVATNQKQTARRIPAGSRRASRRHTDGSPLRFPAYPGAYDATTTLLRLRGGAPEGHTTHALGAEGKRFPNPPRDTHDALASRRGDGNEVDRRCHENPDHHVLKHRAIGRQLRTD